MRKPRRPRTDAEACPLFARFWEAYPRKVDRPAAAKAFARHAPSEELLARQLAAINAQRRSEQWTKNAGEFIPHPAKWLNGRGWEDLPPEILDPAANGKPHEIKCASEFIRNPPLAEPMRFPPRKATDAT